MFKKSLNVKECKAYLRKHGPRFYLVQNQFILRGFLSIGDGNGESLYPISSFPINRDTALFTQKVKGSGKIMGRRTVAGQVVKQQHAFTVITNKKKIKKKHKRNKHKSNMRSLLLALFLVLAFHQGEAAVSCNAVVGDLYPCLSYVVQGGNFPANCCNGIRKLNSQARPKPLWTVREFAVASKMLSEESLSLLTTSKMLSLCLLSVV
ncbi:unnamed protein product [Brassica oleracea]